MALNPNAPRRRCPASGMPVTEIDGADHWRATCPWCDRTFLLPNFSLPKHFYNEPEPTPAACGHFNVRRPTTTDTVYRCVDCGEVITGMAGLTASRPRGCAMDIGRTHTGSGYLWCPNPALPDDDYCAEHSEPEPKPADPEPFCACETSRHFDGRPGHPYGIAHGATRPTTVWGLSGEPFCLECQSICEPAILSGHSIPEGI